MKSVILIIASLVTIAVKSQTVTELAIKFYDEGVNCYNQQNFKKADSLFSLSNYYEPNKDTYFSRAACRQKLENKEGYCSDLAYASYLKDGEAQKLFLKKCGKIDTSYTTEKGQIAAKSDYQYKYITFNYLDSLTIFFAEDKNGKQVKIRPKDKAGVELFTEVEEQASFPGGLSELMKFIKSNLNRPKNAPSGKIYLKFVVFEDGSVHDIVVLKGIESCKLCNDEAVRVVSIMPNWQPAKMKGKPVKCYFNLPISFK